MNERVYIVQPEEITRRGRVGEKCMVGFAFECMMSIYMGSSGVCILQHMAQGWPRCSACTIRGIAWGTMFGNNLRQEEAAYQKEEASAKRERRILTGAVIGAG